jgi:hypothetical protein
VQPDSELPGQGIDDITKRQRNQDIDDSEKNIVLEPEAFDFLSDHYGEVRNEEGNYHHNIIDAKVSIG